MNNKKAKKPQPTYRAIQLAILAELRKHTALLTTLCQNEASSPSTTNGLLAKSTLEDEMSRRGVLADSTLDSNKFSEAERSDDAAKETLATFDALATIVTAAAEKRFAADPFAPTFELFAGEDAVTVKLYPRPGSVQYIVNVTGPRSSAVRIEGGLPSPILVSQVLESPL